MRITTATYWRPSGKNIHKKRDAKDTDSWGVLPEADLEVALSDEEMSRMIQQRKGPSLVTKILNPSVPAALVPPVGLIVCSSVPCQSRASITRVSMAPVATSRSQSPPRAALPVRSSDAATSAPVSTLKNRAASSPVSPWAKLQP